MDENMEKTYEKCVTKTKKEIVRCSRNFAVIFNFCRTLTNFAMFVEVL